MFTTYLESWRTLLFRDSRRSAAQPRQDVPATRPVRNTNGTEDNSDHAAIASIIALDGQLIIPAVFAVGVPGPDDTLTDDPVALNGDGTSKQVAQPRTASQGGQDNAGPGDEDQTLTDDWVNQPTVASAR